MKRLLQQRTDLEIELDNAELNKIALELCLKDIRTDWQLSYDLEQLLKVQDSKIEHIKNNLQYNAEYIEAEKVAPLNYVQWKALLKDLNKSWKLDAVSACREDDYGNMKTRKATVEMEEAETYLVINRAWAGCNYHGPIEEANGFYISHELGSAVAMKKVVADLSKALAGKYEVVAPKSSVYGIEVRRAGQAND